MDDSFLFAQAEPDISSSVEVVQCYAARLGLVKALNPEVKRIILVGDPKSVVSYLRDDLSSCS